MFELSKGKKQMSSCLYSSSAGIISGDSSNVVELVEQQYETITTTIKAEHNASSNCEAKILTKYVFFKMWSTLPASVTRWLGFVAQYWPFTIMKIRQNYKKGLKILPNTK